jgi:type I restriction enzyme S subunit
MQHRFDDIAINSTAKKKPTDSDKDTYLGLEHLDSGSLTVTRFGSDVAPIGEKLLMRKGDVLFGKRRAYQKKVAIAPFDGIFSAHGMVLRPKTNIVTERFFPLFVSSDYFLDAAIKISVGSLSPTINWSALKELVFNLPRLDEQESLADVLWAMIEAKNAYKRLLSLTDDLVKSQFVELFGELTSDEKGFRRVTLKEACEINPRKSADTRLENGLEVSFVPMQAVSEQGEVDSSEIRPYDEVKNGFTYFAENDVLLAKITPCLENGKGGISRNLSNGIGFGSTEFHVMRPKEGVSTPRWLYHLTTFDRFRTEAAENMTGTVGQRRVPTAYLEKYTVPLPPLDLQQRFAAFAEAADKSKFVAWEAAQTATQTAMMMLNSFFGAPKHRLIQYGQEEQRDV